jgi:2-methylcitrate dehydratase
MQADEVLERLAAYAVDPPPFPRAAYDAARLCLLDALGCAALALRHPACTRLLGPLVPGQNDAVPGGARVPGTALALDPIQGAFNTSTLIRWLDYNDTWLAAEWGHPSDNIGALLAVADHLCRTGQRRVTMRELESLIVRAYEIQGVLAIDNSFNRVGFDHVLLVKLACACTVTALLSGDAAAVAAAASQALVDAGPLRTYRHAPNTGSRKSWAAGDAASRGVQLAYLTVRGEPGYPRAVEAPRWGFDAVLLRDKPLRCGPLASHIVEHVLFKVDFPAEFHAQTAAEAAIALHPRVRERLDEIERIDIRTQEAAVRIIDKSGPLANPADRDHCLQYIVAVGLLAGELTDHHYEDEFARDPRIDRLRAVMQVTEEPSYSAGYLDPAERSIANAVQVHYRDGTATAPVEVVYPIGHPRRRAEALPRLRLKLRANLATAFDAERMERIVAWFDDGAALADMTVSDFMDALVVER